MGASLELLSADCFISLVLGKETNLEATLTVNYIATKANAKNSKTIKQSQEKGFKGFYKNQPAVKDLAALPPAEEVLWCLNEVQHFNQTEKQLYLLKNNNNKKNNSVLQDALPPYQVLISPSKEEKHSSGFL